MLSVPKHGWTSFHLGNSQYGYALSYLEDVPIEWLKEAIHGLEMFSPFTVTGFLEPDHMICTVGWRNCYFFHECKAEEEPSLTVHRQPINMLEFCKTLHTDIADHLDEWVEWDNPALQANACEYNEEEDEMIFHQDLYLELYQERKDEIQRLLGRLAELIQQREREHCL